MAAGKDMTHATPPYLLTSKSNEELGLRYYCEYIVRTAVSTRKTLLNS